MRFRRRRVRTASTVEDEPGVTSANRNLNVTHLKIKITPPSVPSVSTLSLHSALDSGLDGAHLRPPSVRPNLQRMPAYRPRSPTPSSRSASSSSAPRSSLPPRSSSIKGKGKESRAGPAIRSNPNSRPGSLDPLPNGQATEGGPGPGPTLSHRSHRAHQAHRGMVNSPQGAEPCAETRAQTSECACPAWPKCKLHDSRANGVAGDITGHGRQNGLGGQNGHARQNGQNGHAGPGTPEHRSLASRLHLTPSKHSRRASWSRTLKTAREMHAVRKWENPELGRAYLAKAYYTDLRSLNAEEKERRELARQAKKNEAQNGWMPLRDS